MGWTAGGQSAAKRGNASLTFGMVGTPLDAVLGLKPESERGFAAENPLRVRYGFRFLLAGGGTALVTVWESGQERTDRVGYDPATDEFEIKRIDGRVQYKINGTEVYASSETVAGMPDLFVQSCLFQSGDAFPSKTAVDCNFWIALDDCSQVCEVVAPGYIRLLAAAGGGEGGEGGGEGSGFAGIPCGLIEVYSINPAQPMSFSAYEADGSAVPDGEQFTVASGTTWAVGGCYYPVSQCSGNSFKLPSSNLLPYDLGVQCSGAQCDGIYVAPEEAAVGHSEVPPNASPIATGGSFNDWVSAGGAPSITHCIAHVRFQSADTGRYYDMVFYSDSCY